jgi:hypothetical protein
MTRSKEWASNGSAITVVSCRLSVIGEEETPEVRSEEGEEESFELSAFDFEL